MTAAVETMAYFGATPWHKLGNKVDASARTDAKAFIEASGLGWTASKLQLAIPSTGELVKAYAVVRDSDHAILAPHVGEDYTVYQNGAAFEWFNPYIQAGLANFETAGSLRGGAVVWVLAKIGEDSVIVPGADDRVGRYLLLANAHNGTMSAFCGTTDIRVVCQNTLAGAMQSNGSALTKIRHTKNMADKLLAARDLITASNAVFDASAEKYRALAAHNVKSKADLAAFVAKVFECPEVGAPRIAPAPTFATSGNLIDDILGDTDLVAEVMAGEYRETTKEKNARIRQDQIETYFEEGRGNSEPGVKGTYWALYNGVTEFLQYTGKRASTAESRLESLTFGTAALTSKRALDVALEMIATA